MYVETVVVKFLVWYMALRTDGDNIVSRHPGRVADIIYGGIIYMNVGAGVTTHACNLRFSIIG